MAVSDNIKQLCDKFEMKNKEQRTAGGVYNQSRLAHEAFILRFDATNPDHVEELVRSSKQLIEADSNYNKAVANTAEIVKAMKEFRDQNMPPNVKYITTVLTDNNYLY